MVTSNQINALCCIFQPTVIYVTFIKLSVSFNSVNILLIFFKDFLKIYFEGGIFAFI